LATVKRTKSVKSRIKVALFFEKVSENAFETRAPHSPDIAEYTNIFFSRSKINSEDTIGLETFSSGTTVMLTILGKRNNIRQSKYGLVGRLIRNAAVLSLRLELGKFGTLEYLNISTDSLG